VIICGRAAAKPDMAASEVALRRPASNSVCTPAGPTAQNRLGQFSQFAIEEHSNPAIVLSIRVGKKAAQAMPVCSDAAARRRRCRRLQTEPAGGFPIKMEMAVLGSVHSDYRCPAPAPFRVVPQPVSHLIAAPRLPDTGSG
jgi:hypothetical protein